MQTPPQKRDFLISARKDRGLKQSDIARITGINPGHYANIEIGKRNPSVNLAKKISKILDLNWIDFFD